MNGLSVLGPRVRLLLITFIFAGLALLIEAPLIAFPFFAGEQYQGINIAPYGNDEHYYLTRAKEVLEGHSLGQPFLHEGKDLPDSFQTNIEQILLFPLTATGIGPSVDVVTLYNILNFLGIVVLLLLIYLFVYEISGDVLLALATATFVVGGYVLIENKTVLYWILSGQSPIHGGPNLFGRSIYPYVTLVPFFGFLIFTYRAVMSRFERISRTTIVPYLYVLSAGALFGSLFYNAFYGWTFTLALLGSLTLAALLWRRWHAALATVGIGVIGVALGSYKLVGYYQLFTSDIGAQISYFKLTMYSHAFIMSTTGLATALLFALYFYLRRYDENNFFIFATILAGWVALEQQILTGLTVQYGHYYWYFVVPLSILVSLYMVSRLVPARWRMWWQWACIVLIVVAFSNTAAGQYKWFFDSAPGKMREQQFAPIVHALAQLPKGVVLGDPGTESYSNLVTIYTDDDVYWAPAAVTSYVPLEHLREAILVYWYLNKDMRRDPAVYMKRVLSTSERTTYTGMYEDLERYESGLPLDSNGAKIARDDPRLVAAREKLLSELSAEYRALTRSPQILRAALLNRGIRYVLWDTELYPEWDLSVFDSLKEIARSGDIRLYEFPE